MRVALFYGALFVFYGMHTPYMPVWLAWRGLTPEEISVVIAAPLFLRVFVSPVIASVADRSAAYRYYLVLFAWLSMAFVLVLTSLASFYALLLFAIALMLSNSTILPLIETIAVAGVRNHDLDYGQMRLWGSLSFLAASFVGGLVIELCGGGAGIWLIVLGCAVTVIAGHYLPPDNRIDQAVKTSVPIWRSSALRELVSQKEFCIFLVASGFVIAAHAMFFTFGILIWRKQGISSAWAGTLWAICIFAEVMLMGVSGWAVARIGAAQLIVLGALASIVRWAVMAFEPSPAVLFPLQLLHGLTYGASHIGAIHFIKERVALDKQGTAQSLYATMASGLALGAATLIAGWFYKHDGSYAYFAMVAISGVSLLAALWLVSHVTLATRVSPKAPATAVE